MEWIKIFSNRQEVNNRVSENQPRLLIVNGLRFCLVVQKDKLYAVEDRCPHNGESLSKGQVNYLSEIICPFHGYRFKLETGRECAERCRDLITYPILEKEDGIFIGL